MERVPWTGRVMEVAEGQIYINAGQDAAMKEGDTFAVTSVVRELTDPETGAVRGVIENRVGQVRVEKVEEKFLRLKTQQEEQQTQDLENQKS